MPFKRLPKSADSNRHYRQHYYTMAWLLALFLSSVALAQDPQFPVRQVFRSTYPAQYIGSVWQENNQFRVVLGYSNACTIAMPDSFQWKSGQLNGSRICFDRIDQGDGEQSVAVAVKRLSRTELRLFRIGDEAEAEVIDSVTDASYWEQGVNYRTYESISSIKSVGNEDDNLGLMVYSNYRFFSSISGGADKTWRLSGELCWTYLNHDDEGGRFPTGGISCLESLQLAGEADPRLYYGVTYESGSYSPGEGGLSTMTCELIRFDLASASEESFHTFATERNEDGVKHEIATIFQIKAGVHDDFGPVVFAVFGHREVERLVLLDGNDLELIASMPLPAEAVAGELADIVYTGNGGEGGADLLCIYESGQVLAVTVVGDVLEVVSYTLGGIVISAVAANFDGDEALELGVTMDRRLHIFEQLPLGVESPVFLQPTSAGISVFPNPFNSSTTISYSLPKPGRYALDVVDIQGRLVTRLADGWREAGSYREVLNGGQLTSGEYMLRLNGASESFAKPITIIK